MGTVELETDPFTLVGLTWAAIGASTGDARLLVRTRDARGWTDWTELHEDGHGPDPQSAEGRAARSGTAPLIVSRSHGVQVRVETNNGRLPRDFRIDLVDPGESQADASVATLSATGQTTTSSGQPAILSRADWGADETIRDQDEPAYGAVRGMFVHHTDGANNYSEADVPGIIRGIYVFHVNGRGWRDIGYNFLIDRFGKIWEGRYGGVDRAVVGAHVAGYNSNAFGAAVLGNYSSKLPEAAVLDAYRDLIAWKFTHHAVRPTDQVAYPGQATLPAIAGHRDGSATECPGNHLYAALPGIRSSVANQMRRFADLVLTSPYSATAGRDITHHAEWTVDGEPVSGTVSLESNVEGEWNEVKQFSVIDGSGSTTTRVYAPQRFRLRAVSVDSHDDIETSHPAGTSNEQYVIVRRQASPLPGDPFTRIPM